MSENPVRSASVKAAKEIWVLKNTSSVPSEIQSQMADIIESKFAPVVAAAEEAMAEKCAGAVCEWCRKGFLVIEYKVSNANGWFYHKPDPLGLALTCVAHPIRAIPTGTALAEYTEDAAGQALARMFYLIEHPDEIVPVSETSYYTNDYAIAFRELIERAKAGWRAGMQPKLDYLNNGWRERDEYIASLKAQQAEVVEALENANKLISEAYGEFVSHEYIQVASGLPPDGSKDTRWMKEAASHLERIAALSAPAKEGESPKHRTIPPDGVPCGLIGMESSLLWLPEELRKQGK